MQPARLGGLWCFALSASFAILALAPSARAQAVVETPQQTNQRIRELSAEVARSGPRDYTIGNGDVLDIDVFDVKELSREVRVSQTGTIGLPLVPVRLHVSGLTERQAEQKIAEVLAANGLVTHPDVSVIVKERRSKPITIVGAVNKPLVYQADRPVTLLEVLAEAGGLAPDAGEQVIISRPIPDMTFDETDPPALGSSSPKPNSSRADSPASASISSAADKSAAKPATPATPERQTNSLAVSTGNSSNEPPDLPGAEATSQKSGQMAMGPASPTEIITVHLGELETGDTRNNVSLQAGDVVTVPHSGIVYVLGAVEKPGGYVLTNDREKLTTLKILALAGGFTNTAKSSHAMIIRKDAQGKQHSVDVDLKKIRDQKQEDLQLQPSDILYVPQSGAKTALLRSVEFGVALGSAVALYRLAYRQ